MTGFLVPSLRERESYGVHSLAGVQQQDSIITFAGVGVLYLAQRTI